MGVNITYTCDHCQKPITEGGKVYTLTFAVETYVHGLNERGGYIAQDPQMQNRKMLICNGCKELLVDRSTVKESKPTPRSPIMPVTVIGSQPTP